MIATRVCTNCLTIQGKADKERRMFPDIEYESHAEVSPDELLGFYVRQNHATTQSRQKLQKMLDNTFCVVTARRNGELIGFARGVTDGLTGRLAECKLDPSYQGPACVTRTDGRIEHDTAGIAREMARRAIEALRTFGVEKIDAVAYGTEVDFCEELGFKRQRGVVALELPADTPTPAPVAVAAELSGRSC
jgi:predicted N-acetyltransferase YhbS